MHSNATSSLFTAILTTGLFLTISSCNKCDDEPVISYFAFEEFSPKKMGVIDQSEHTITIEVPDSINVTNLSPTIDLGSSSCLNLSPLSGTSQDFSTPVIYEVSNDNGDMAQYEVTVTFKSNLKKDSIHISWNTGNDIPIPVGWSAISMIDTKFFITGGANEALGVSDKIQIYDPETDSWTISESRLNHKRWGHSSTVVDGLIYVIGGTSEARGIADSIIEIYDPASGNWSLGEEMDAGRIGHGAVTHNGKIYIAGGEFEEPSLTTLRSLEMYDPVTGNWESLAPMLTPRIFMALCVVGDTIYAIGGGSKYPYAGLKTIEAYIISEDRWEQKANLKLGLGDLDPCVIDGKIFCTGGWALWLDVGIAAVQVYDPKADQVYLADNMQFSRGATATIAYQDKVYVISGMQAMKPEPIMASKTEIGVPEF
jgi:hypothetical protein